ncbi:MAG: hypothetical protein B6I36_03925 [Desulfobacteraceae bacterium 4572_35.1]|nr:MAG: hypothetical protein B6I36_03925 [Desulfobacteraceae bacterium 4572_35.1]
MTSSIFMHPAVLFIVGAMLLPLFKKYNAQKIWLVAVPLLAFLQIRYLPSSFGCVEWLGFKMQFGRVDQLTIVFLHVFTLMALIGSIFGLHVKESGQHASAWLYVAGSLGTTLAGDYLVVFIFWELMAFASVFLVWYRKQKRSIEAGYRYLLVHTTGGLILLGGIFLHYQRVHDLSFVAISPDTATLAEYLIMVGFMLNAAVPPIHAWLPDAYPEATVTGAVFMCAFTTKTAVYVLARGFAGFEALAILGAIMTLYGVFYAVIENDARRILAYHIVSQVGYMVCGVGIGTHMAINGACAHAYAHILYKALLFMGIGSVLEMTGRSKLSELGGLYKYMPFTMLFTVIGGISISGFPLTSGSYHLAETFHLLGFTALGFYLMVKYLTPHDVSNLDLDWFYRRGAGWFMWTARNPVSASNEWISNVYKNVGLRFTMALARALSWFDWEGIDWALDGSARGVVKGGEQVRQFQTGKLQQYIGGAVAALFIILIVVVFI